MRLVGPLVLRSGEGEFHHPDRQPLLALHDAQIAVFAHWWVVDPGAIACSARQSGK